MVGKIKVFRSGGYDPEKPKPPSESERVYAIIPKLTAVQRQAFGRICMEDDSYLGKRTAEVLVRHGLITYGLERGIYRAHVASEGVHAMYCLWCDNNFTEDDFDKDGNLKPGVPERGRGR
jgi:hypothetical protein